MGPWDWGLAYILSLVLEEGILGHRMAITFFSAAPGWAQGLSVRLGPTLSPRRISAEEKHEEDYEATAEDRRVVTP